MCGTSLLERWWGVGAYNLWRACSAPSMGVRVTVAVQVVRSGKTLETAAKESQ